MSAEIDLINPSCIWSEKLRYIEAAQKGCIYRVPEHQCWVDFSLAHAKGVFIIGSREEMNIVTFSKAVNLAISLSLPKT